MTEDATTTAPGQTGDQSDTPDPPTGTASRVRVLLQLCGGVIAVVQGAVLPFVGIPTSVPVFLGAVGLAGVVAPAISFDARRRGKDPA